MFDIPHHKSLAYSKYLNRYFEFIEFKTLCESLRKIGKREFIKLRKTNYKMWRLALTIKNQNFLYSELKNNGGLYCSYCDIEKQRELVIYDLIPNMKHILEYVATGDKKYFGNKFSRHDGATVDHYYPISKGGEPLDKTNLRVCCEKCNISKKDMLPNEWNLLKNKQREK